MIILVLTNSNPIQPEGLCLRFGHAPTEIIILFQFKWPYFGYNQEGIKNNKRLAMKEENLTSVHIMDRHVPDQVGSIRTPNPGTDYLL